MPPRRLKHAGASPSPSPVPEPLSPRSDVPSSASPSADLSHDDLEPSRFFNTTFTTYRVSPLYVGKQTLNTARLQLFSRRLRDVLVGDVVRGVQVGLESDAAALGRTGALLAVEWRWVDVALVLGETDRQAGSVELGNNDDGDNESDDQRKRLVLCLELRYENARFSALLLPDLGGDDESRDSAYQPSWTWQENDSTTQTDEVDQSAFIQLPLLLFRMPAPLKSVLIDFLSSTFDCRISPLALGTRTLMKSWEDWLADSRRSLSRDILLTLGFHVEPPKPKPRSLEHDDDGVVDNEGPARKQDTPHLGMKSIDIGIPALQVRRFLRMGRGLDNELQAIGAKRKADATTTLSDEQQSRRRRKLAAGEGEEGWAWRSQSHKNDNRETETIDQPFAEALATYLWHHLGLDMFHPGVRVQRVACDGFALSEGRLKVFPPPRSGANEEESAAWKLMRGLVRKARGRPGWNSVMTTRTILG
ncbi:kinetochore complex Sim4 subunit Fta1-domain-containing protein [Hypoxylon crocopeplum]|nr:kinetochore complex Sim4 subunit Fta1-domain-containing protein [Hypoxylon crocopeplum]